MKNIYKIFGLLLLLTLGAFNVQAQKVVAYYPTWTGFPTSFNAIDLTKITHLNVAFYNPNTSGTLTNGDGLTTANLATIVTACHAKNVKVLVSIGGAGAPGSTYKTLFASATTSQAFVTKLVTFVTANNLDGLDVDIEGDILDGSTLTAAQYQTFVGQLATSLHAQNKVMSAALASWFADYVTTTAVQSFDYVGLMSYDAAIPGSGDKAAQHSPYQMVLDDVSTWEAKGLAASKIVVGVPFYGYGWGTKAVSGNDEIAYCDIVTANAGAENADIVGSGSNAIYYNGIPTIQKKTTYALANTGGVMIWEITEDCPSSSAKSLLSAIDKLVKAASGTAPTITFGNLSKVYGDASFSMTATSNSTGAITYTATGTGATITSAGVVTITGAGTVTVTATQAAATGFTAGTSTATLTIAKKVLTVTADAKSKAYNTANPALTVSYTGFAGSDNAASLTTAASATTTATLTSNVGTYTITPAGAASNNYSFTYVNGTLTVTTATATLTLANVNKTFGDASFTEAATSNSTGAITYTATGTGASITSAGVVTITGAGTVTVTASQAATANYAAATTTATITIAKAAAALTLADVNKTFGDASFTESATSNSTGPITYTATGTGASITSAGVVTITGAGTVTVTASVAATANYAAATTTAMITIAKAAATLTLADVNKTFGDASFTESATSNSAGAITYTATGTGASITSAGVVTITGAGTVTVTASVAATANYAAATTTAMITIAKAVPTLAITSASSGNVGGKITLSSTTNSSGTITYSIGTGGTGSGSVAGGILSLNSAGTITVQATVAATANYTALTVTQTVNASVTTGVDDTQISGGFQVYPNPFINVVSVKSSDPITNVVIYDLAGSVVYQHDSASNELHISTDNFTSGIYILKASTSKGEQLIKIVK